MRIMRLNSYFYPRGRRVVLMLGFGMVILFISLGYIPESYIPYLLIRRRRKRRVGNDEGYRALDTLHWDFTYQSPVDEAVQNKYLCG